ncbi:urea ABC transporter permease subunit UrtC [Wenyingzhuangia aestuarii]|uniref:urea ABC transporter permease subunit UrtC n=1 Tax=Wenyingzhuangia aestuarii TaxID=1647582 RepID=UPI00143C5CAE|nr:urea ABC transporter permease subunit UrtC [Wenyingzhuangia aestuarii]NJB83418.1 urea transport system permease protein [Wenyingzhuangia aestuarii]
MLKNKIYIIFILVFALLMPIGYFTGLVPINTLTLWGRYFCLAIAALGVDLIWGYTGILSMTQALFFCMGAYGMGMYMTLSNLPEGQFLPSFMVWNQVTELPFFWVPFDNFSYALVLSILVPGVFAGVLGYFIFRKRIKGVYFAIITQAIALAMFLLFSRNETMLGGTNGLTDFKFFLGFDLRDTSVKFGLYILSLLALGLIYWYCHGLVNSKFGKALVAIRDSESRMRFTKYKVTHYSVAIFMIGAMIAAVGGMLYMPQTGIITPGRMDVQASIEMIIWVALGGRGKLKGAVVGALVLNLMYSVFTTVLPSSWLYILGGLFVITVLYLPKGIVGLVDQMKEKLNSMFVKTA